MLEILKWKKDDVPLILTFFIGFAIWGVQHIASGLASRPLLEWSQDDTELQTVKTSHLTFSNLSNSVKYKNILVGIIADKKKCKIISGRLFFDDRKYIESRETPSNVDTTNNAATFIIESLQPGSKAYVEIAYSGFEEPFVKFSSDEALVFTERSCLTWILRYEYLLIGIAVLSFLVVSIISLCLK